MGIETDIFKKVANARPKGAPRLPKLTQGSGVLIIDSIRLEGAQKPFRWKVTGFVKSSRDTPGAVKDDNATIPDRANPPGTVVEWVRFLGGKFEGGKDETDVRDFVEKMVGRNDLTPAQLVSLQIELTNEDPNAEGADGESLEVNPMRGFEIGYRAYGHILQAGPNVGNQQTRVEWIHRDTTPEQVEGNRAQLEGRAPGAAS